MTRIQSKLFKLDNEVNFFIDVDLPASHKRVRDCVLELGQHCENAELIGSRKGNFFAIRSVVSKRDFFPENQCLKQNIIRNLHFWITNSLSTFKKPRFYDHFWPIFMNLRHFSEAKPGKSVWGQKQMVKNDWKRKFPESLPGAIALCLRCPKSSRTLFSQGVYPILMGESAWEMLLFFLIFVKMT